MNQRRGASPGAERAEAQRPQACAARAETGPAPRQSRDVDPERAILFDIFGSVKRGRKAVPGASIRPRCPVVRS